MDAFRGDLQRCRKCAVRASTESRARRLVEDRLGGAFAEKRWRAFRDEAYIRKIAVEISLAEYRVLCTQPCYYCGDTIIKGAGLDRIDNNQHYTPANVVPCCGTCNLMRGRRWTSEEFKIYFGPVVRIAKAARNGVHPPDAWGVFLAMTELADRVPPKPQAAPVQATGADPVRDLRDPGLALPRSGDDEVGADG